MSCPVVGRWMGGWMERCMDEQVNRCVGGRCTDGRTDGWVNGWVTSFNGNDQAGGEGLLGQPASCSSREWGRRERFLPSRLGLSPLWSCLLDTFLWSCLFGRPCTCNSAGSLGTCDPRSGRCPCKENVEGNLCDRWVNPSNCKPAGSDLSDSRGAGGGALTDLGNPTSWHPS